MLLEKTHGNLLYDLVRSSGFMSSKKVRVDPDLKDRGLKKDGRWTGLTSCLVTVKISKTTDSYKEHQGHW